MTFATDLTQKERQLGFFQAFVSDPSAGQLDAGIVPAVVYRVRDGERVVKLSSGHYSHQIFGCYMGILGKSPPDWLTISGPHANAELAITVGRAGGDPTETVAHRIQAATPTILLRCPKCSTDFIVNADHLPLDSTQTCPSATCRITGPTEAFSG